MQVIEVFAPNAIIEMYTYALVGCISSDSRNVLIYTVCKILKCLTV